MIIEIVEPGFRGKAKLKKNADGTFSVSRPKGWTAGAEAAMRRILAARFHGTLEVDRTEDPRHLRELVVPSEKPKARGRRGKRS